jgi:hypothetical protein
MAVPDEFVESLWEKKRPWSIWGCLSISLQDAAKQPKT